MSAGPASNNLSLRRKTAARVAAIQSLYGVSIGSNSFSPAKLVAEYRDRLEERPGDKTLTKDAPNWGMMESILSGVHEHLEEVDGLINENLQENWKRERMSKLSIIILQTGIFELRFHDTLKTGVLLKEYGDLAARFLDATEIDFVTALLNKLAPKLRP